jgi:hypothetical protein
MKNILTTVIGIILVSFIFASCKKNYTCTCFVNETQYVYHYNDLKSNVKETCNQQDAAAKLVDTTATGGCELSKD